MRKLKNIILLMVIILLSGCVRFPETEKTTSNSKLTVGMTKKIIKKGETTQSEILSSFGSPNLITKNRSSNEVWNYNKMSFESKEGRDGGSLIFWGGSRAMTTTTTKSFDLIIIFNDKDIVKDYSIIYASY